MAIYIVEGKIGSGKSYYCVYSLSKKYYIYDEVLCEYLPRANVVVVTNLDSLKLSHLDLDFEIQTYGLSYVFSKDYVEKVRRENNAKSVIFLIDETQRYFDRKFYDKEIFFFFQYSRHYGVDMYLVTQDVDSLAKELRNLSEYYIHAVSRTFVTRSSFRYKFVSDNEVLRSIIVPYDKRVFALYQSFIVDELEKPRPILYRYVAIFSFLVLLSVCGYFFLFVPFFRSRLVAKKVSKVTVVSSSSEVLSKASPSSVVFRERAVPLPVQKKTAVPAQKKTAVSVQKKTAVSVQKKTAVFSAVPVQKKTAVFPPNYAPSVMQVPDVVGTIWMGGSQYDFVRVPGSDRNKVLKDSPMLKRDVGVPFNSAVFVPVVRESDGAEALAVATE